MTKTPAGISMIIPASQITNQERSLLLNWPVRMRMGMRFSGQGEGAQTVHKYHADANCKIFEINVRLTMDPWDALIWAWRIEAEIEKMAKVGLDKKGLRTLPIPLSKFWKLLREYGVHNFTGEEVRCGRVNSIIRLLT